MCILKVFFLFLSSPGCNRVVGRGGGGGVRPRFTKFLAAFPTARCKIWAKQFFGIEASFEPLSGEMRVTPLRALRVPCSPRGAGWGAGRGVVGARHLPLREAAGRPPRGTIVVGSQADKS